MLGQPKGAFMFSTLKPCAVRGCNAEGRVWVSKRQTEQTLRVCERCSIELIGLFGYRRK